MESSLLFYELIQVALGNKDKLSRMPSEREWSEIYAISQKQAVTGLAFLALEKLNSADQPVPKFLLYEWIGAAEIIRQQNLIVNERCREITSLFKDAGYNSCILKGQGNARMYPVPWARQSGDIDVWVDGSKDEIVSLVLSNYPGATIQSHHIDYPVFDDVDVEVHFIPTYSIVSRFQKNLGKFIEVEKASQFENPVSLPDTEGFVNVPTDNFNVIFQLSHMQCHFFYGGIGLRQIIDYYLILKNAHNIKEKKDIEQIIKDVGLYRFAQAVSWILKDVLGLNEERLITKPDRKRGELLLDEIMQGGSFGHYDQRSPKKLMRLSTTLSIFAQNIKLIRLFPEEAISAPINGVIRSIKK